MTTHDIPHNFDVGYACGARRVQSTPDGTPFFSVGYDLGMPYPNDLDCQWTVKAAAGARIHMIFPFFQLEFQRNCNYDWLEIYDGDDMISRYVITSLILIHFKKRFTNYCLGV